MRPKNMIILRNCFDIRCVKAYEAQGLMVGHGPLRFLKAGTPPSSSRNILGARFFLYLTQPPSKIYLVKALCLTQHIIGLILSTQIYCGFS